MADGRWWRPGAVSSATRLCGPILPNKKKILLLHTTGHAGRHGRCPIRVWASRVFPVERGLLSRKSFQ
eukprot:6940442-Prymnesium_polylepis.1